MPMGSSAPFPPVQSQLYSAWDADMEALERFARLEAKMEFLAETVNRNREEGKSERNDMRLTLERLTVMMTAQNESLDARLGGLLSTMEQVKGAKKTLATIGAILSAIGLVGLYQIASWLGFVKAHP